MARALVAAALAWPLLLGAGTVAAMREPASAFGTLVYLAAGAVCHQRDDRSFHTHKTKWPVCARCSGLYLAAPVGAVAALTSRRRRHKTTPGRLPESFDLSMLAALAVPTAFTFVAEHGGLMLVSSSVRFLTALPLGAAIAWVIVRVANGPDSRIG